MDVVKIDFEDCLKEFRRWRVRSYFHRRDLFNFVRAHYGPMSLNEIINMIQIMKELNLIEKNGSGWRIKHQPLRIQYEENSI
jgi:hypothetical protein